MRPQRILLALLLAPTALLAWVGALRLEAENGAALLPPSVVGEVIEAVSPAELEAYVCHLQDKDALGYCNTQGSRYSLNPEGLREAAGYIAQQFGDDGLLVTTQPFTDTNLAPGEGPGVVLTNVIGILEGVAPPAERGIVIVSAHYDSTSNQAAVGGPAPGADDNASGVAAVLEAARLLSGHQTWHTVRFVTFAGEEQGLHGSRHYARQADQNGDNIIAVVNLDMIAYNGDSEPRLEIHAGVEKSNTSLAHTLVGTIEAYRLDLQPQIIGPGATRLSDHASFWDYGFPAVLMIEDTDLSGPTYDFNPYYHSVDDTLDKIDRGYFAEMARAAAGTVARLARPDRPDLGVVQDGPTLVEPGATVTFTLAYSNVGTMPAAGVMLTETLSHGLIYQADSSGDARAFDVGGHVIWDLGDLAVGAGGRFVVTATVQSDVPDLTAVSSRLLIAGAGLDADGIDNVSGLEIPVRQEWRLYVPLLRSDGGTNNEVPSGGHVLLDGVVGRSSDTSALLSAGFQSLKAVKTVTTNESWPRAIRLRGAPGKRWGAG